MRQDGYYIYYERNEDMQNYMVDHKSGESTEQQAGNAFLKKKEEIMERRLAQKRRAERSHCFLSLEQPLLRRRKTQKMKKGKYDFGF